MGNVKTNTKYKDGRLKHNHIKVIVNISSLNTTVKRLHKNARPNYMLCIRNHFKNKDTDRLKLNRWKKICHANTNHKKAGVTMSI